MTTDLGPMSSLQLLIEALRRYAAQALQVPADDAAVAVEAWQVRHAAIAFGDEIFERCGHGNVFAYLHTDMPPTPDEVLRDRFVLRSGDTCPCCQRPVG